MDIPNQMDEENLNNQQWSWFVEECNIDAERRRAVYSCGDTLKCWAIRGEDLFTSRRKFCSIARICLFLPHPLQETVGPLHFYVNSVNASVLDAIPANRPWLGFNAGGPLLLPFFPWRYEPGHQFNSLETRIRIFRQRIGELREQLERPDRHFEMRLHLYFGESGIEPCLTLAFTTYLSQFHLLDLDVIHLYTALLFSGRVLKKFERKFSRINRAIKKDMIGVLRTLIGSKRALGLPYIFEAQSLSLLRSRKVQEVFLYVHQYGSYAELRRLIDDRVSMGPHFFFKVVWKGVPFNKLFLGFIKIKPSDYVGFISDLNSRKDSGDPVPTSHFSNLKLHGVPYNKPLDFLRQHWPVRIGCKTERPLVGGKVLSLKSSLALPNRDLNWEEEMLLTYRTTKNVKDELVSEWVNRSEYKQINYLRVADEELCEHILNEGLPLWKAFPKKSSAVANKIPNATDKKIDVGEIDRSYLSYPLDFNKKLRFVLIHSAEPINIDIHERIKIRRNVEEMRTLIIENLKFGGEEFITKEIRRGDVFEEEQGFLKPQIDKFERVIMEVEAMRFDILSWNRRWRLKPFCEPFVGNIIDETQKPDEEGNFEKEANSYSDKVIKEYNSDSEQLNYFHKLNHDKKEINNGEEKYGAEVNYDKGRNSKHKNIKKGNSNIEFNPDNKHDYEINDNLREEGGYNDDEDVTDEDESDEEEDANKDEETVEEEKNKQTNNANFYVEVNNEDELLGTEQQIESISSSPIVSQQDTNLKEKVAYPKRDWNNRHKEPPYWLQATWKKIKWINWRGRNKLWMGNALNNIDFLGQRNQVLKDILLELKKYERAEHHGKFEQNKDTESSSSSISKSTSFELLKLEPESESLEPIASSSTFSSQSSSDCEYIRSAFRANWGFSAPTLYSDLIRTVAFLEMCGRVLKQKEEIQRHASENRALSEVPRKLYLSQCIQRCINLFIKYEESILARLSLAPSTSTTSITSRKSRSRSGFQNQNSSMKHSEWYDSGLWLSRFRAQISHELFSEDRVLAHLKSLGRFENLVLGRFLAHVTCFGELTDSLRWKLSVKCPIRSECAFHRTCCRIAPIRKAAFLGDLLFQCSSLRELLKKKIEESLVGDRSSGSSRQNSHTRSTMRSRSAISKFSSTVSTGKTSSAASTGKTSSAASTGKLSSTASTGKLSSTASTGKLSSTASAGNFSKPETTADVDRILFRKNDELRKWPKKKEWPIPNEEQLGHIDLHWVDKTLFDQ